MRVGLGKVFVGLLGAGVLGCVPSWGGGDPGRREFPGPNAPPAKADTLRDAGPIFNASDPRFQRPPTAATLGCATPCTGFGTMEADNPFYDVFLSCNDGSFTA